MTTKDSIRSMVDTLGVSRAAHAMHLAESTLRDYLQGERDPQERTEQLITLAAEAWDDMEDKPMSYSKRFLYELNSVWPSAALLFGLCAILVAVL